MRNILSLCFYYQNHRLNTQYLFTFEMDSPNLPINKHVYKPPLVTSTQIFNPGLFLRCPHFQYVLSITRKYNEIKGVFGW